MKRYAVLFSFLLLSLVLISPPTAVSLTVSFHKRWALIVTAHLDFQKSYDVSELRVALADYYDFTVRRIAEPDKQDIREAITDWIGSRSDSDDLVFIYIEGHGTGYDLEEGCLDGPEDAIDGSRGDPRDEGDEFRETDINIDFDEDGVLESDVWGGIDESIMVLNSLMGGIPEYYWDDEVKEDLATLSYGRLIFFWNGPKLPNSTGSCHSGGFVRDLSAPDRIIVAPSSETEIAWGRVDPETGYCFGYFSRPFIRALSPNFPSYFQEANINGDGAVSIWEAFNYAYQNDPARIDGRETPQLDDNGDGVADSGDGLLSYRTLLISERPLSTDVNWDGRVNVIDITFVTQAYGSLSGDPLYNPYVDFDGNEYIDIHDGCRIALDLDKTYLDTGGAGATGTPEVSVYPNEINVYKDQTFSVDVTIADVTDLYCYQFDLYYNTAILECTGVDLPPGHFLEPILDPDNIFIVEQEYDNAYNATHGRVEVTVALMVDEPGKNGGGTLATINFKAKEFGSSTLHFYDVVIGNSLPEAMPVILVDGSVNVLPTLTVLAEEDGNSLTTGYVYIDDQYRGRTGSTFTVLAGTRKVFVSDFWGSLSTGDFGYRYSFQYWVEDGSTENPRDITVLEDTTITAHFKKKWCPGDVDGDGDVDSGDMRKLQLAMGSTPGAPNWDSRADVNGDGRIDVRDQRIAQLNFGNEYP